MENGIWQKRASVLISAVIVLFFLHVLVRYAGGPVLVCGLSFVVASSVQPAAGWLSKVLGISKGVASGICLSVLLLTAGGLLALGVTRLWRELSEALHWLGTHGAWLTGELDRGVSLLLPGVSEEGAMSVSETLVGWLGGVLDALGGAAASGVGDALRTTPRVLMLIGICLIACFYLSLDYDAVIGRVTRLLPKSQQGRVRVLCRRARRLLLGYVRAYALLMALTFFEVLIGMMILGQPYGFLIAVCVALVDLLPILGAGAILIPWGLISLASGRIGFGVGLLILYAVMTVIRQLVEPRLVGSSLGLHPLCSLLCMFTGYWCFGAFGMLLAPLLVRLLRDWRMLEEGNEKNL